MSPVSFPPPAAKTNHRYIVYREHTSTLVSSDCCLTVVYPVLNNCQFFLIIK
jgi:hypothetical protein